MTKPNAEMLARIERITRLTEQASYQRIRGDGYPDGSDMREVCAQKAASYDNDVDAECDRLRQDIIEGNL